MEKNCKVNKNVLSKGIKNKEMNAFNDSKNCIKERNIKEIDDNNRVKILNNKKDIEFVNNSDFIRDLISLSRKRKLKEKDDKKENKINNISNNNLKNKIKYENNNKLLNENNNIQFHQLTEPNNKMDKQIITEENTKTRNITLNSEQIFKKNSTLFNSYFIKKSNNNIEKNKPFLKIEINNALKSSSFKNIREPKHIHYKGVIQPKNNKINHNNKDFFDNENYNQKYNEENIKSNYINGKQILNVQRNKIYNSDNKINYNKNKKLFINDSINEIKRDIISKFNFNNGIKKNSHIHNNTLSFNNFNNNLTSLPSKKNLLTINKENPKNNEIKNKSLEKNKNTKNYKEEEEEKDYYQIKYKIIYQKLNKEKIINSLNSPIKKQNMNLRKNNPKETKSLKSDLNSNIKFSNNINNYQKNSVLLNNKFKNYKKEYSNSNISEEGNNNDNMYLFNENNKNLRNSYTFQDNYDKDKNTNNKTDINFYNEDFSNTLNLKDSKSYIELLKTEPKILSFNKLAKKRSNDFNDIKMNKSNIVNKKNNNIFYSKHKIYNMQKYKSYYRNDNDTNNSDNEYFFSNVQRIQSSRKSLNKIYKKPLYKNNFLEISKTANTINNNFIIYKDEINFINKKNEYNINNEKINIELFNNNKNFIIDKINKKIENKKHFFYSKYYLYHLKKPKIGINYIEKFKYFYKDKQLKFSPKKLIVSSICKFTKLFLIKKKNITSNNSIKKDGRTNLIYSHLKIKNNIIKENKAEKMKNQFEKKFNSKNLCNSSSKKKNIKIVLYKYKIHNNNSIKNDIIFLLNIITYKNILSIENQIMKLIIINNNNLNIKNNEKEAKSFIKEILNNINLLVKILINKVISETKYIELYIKLCYDLFTKYLKSINDLLLKTYLDKCIDNNDYNIIINLKKMLNKECMNKYENLLKSNFNEEYKQNLLNLLNFIYLSLENEIIGAETFALIINNLLNIYEETELLEYKYYFLYLIIYFLIKMQDKKNNKDIYIFIDKVHHIIKKDFEENKPSKYLKIKIEEFINIFSNKIKIKTEDDKELNIFELIKQDIDNYINLAQNMNNENKNKNFIKEKYEKEYDFQVLKFSKNIELEDLIKNFIDITINSNLNEGNIVYYKSYLKYIIEQISNKLSLNKLRVFHNKMLLIFSDLNQICTENDCVFEIIGYLIYSLIENELCDAQDMNIFINKEEKSKINICKIIKYIILSSENNIRAFKKYYEDFKNLELFKNNSLFNDYIICDINKKITIVE